MEENKYTDLDKLFKDRLNKTSQDDTTWNLPSDGVFEGAMNEIHDNRRRRMMVIWLVAGAFLLALITAFIINLGKVDKLERALAEKETQLIENRAAMAELIKNSEEIGNREKGSEKSKPQADDEFEQGLHIQKAEEAGVPDRRLESENISQSIQPKIQAVTDDVVFNSKVDVLIPIPQAEHAVEFTVPSVPLMSVLILNETQLQIPEPLRMDYIANIGDLEWYIGTTTHWTTLDMKGIEESTASLTEYDKRYLGYGLRAGLVQNLPGRWSLDYRCSYQHFTNKSAFNDDLVYDDDLERVDANGKTMYSMDLSILSPMSELNRAVAFEVDDYPIVDEDVFENVTRISEEYHWLTVAVIPNYNIINSSKWSISAGLGLQANYLIKMKEDMDVKLYFESEMMKNEIILNDPSKNVNPWSLASLGELNLSRELNERSSLSLTAGMQQSITPINTPKNGVAPRTYVNDLQLGLNFNFKI